MTSLDGSDSKYEESKRTSVEIIVDGRRITVIERHYGDFDRNPDGSIAKSTIRALQRQFALQLGVGES